MSDIKQDIMFSGFLDLDSDPRTVAPGDYTDGYNFRKSGSDGKNVNTIVPIKGTTEVALPSGASTGKGIGDCEDIKNNASIIFRGETTNSSILSLSSNTKTITKVLFKEPILNFNFANKIHSANIVGDYLTWTDGLNQPRKLNIPMAKAYEAAKSATTRGRLAITAIQGVVVGGFDVLRVYCTTAGAGYALGDRIALDFNDETYRPIRLIQRINSTAGSITGTYIDTNIPFTPGAIINTTGYLYYYDYANGKGYDSQYFRMSEQELAAISWPPNKPPTSEYYSDTNQESNFLKGGMWQFCYRWVYVGGRKSVCSPWSKIPLNNAEITFSGKDNPDQTENNVLLVSYDSGSIEVESVEILVRNGSNGQWMVAEVLNKYDGDGIPIIASNNTQVYYFNNSKRMYAADQAEALRYYDAIPLLANTQTVVNNKLFYGGITEGQDPITANIALSAEYDLYSALKISKHAGASVTDPPEGVHLALGGGGMAATGTVWKTYITAVKMAGSVIIDSKTFEVEYTQLSTDTTWAILGANISAAITTAAGGVVLSTFLPIDALGYTNVVTVINGSMDVVYDETELVWGDTNYKETTFKDGREHMFGLVYFDDEGRPGSIEQYTDGRTPSTSLYIPPYPSFRPLGGAVDDYARDGNIKASVYWQIKHLPPIWAKKYQWVQFKNTNTFWQYQISTITSTPIIAPDVAPRTLSIVLKYPSSDFNLSNKSVVPVYQWQRGDRIRFIANKVGGLYKSVPGLVDMEIVEQSTDPATDGWELKVEMFPYDTEYSIDTDTIVEIYTPLKDVQPNAYFEIGECFEIGNPGTANRYHKAGATYSRGSSVVQNQDPANPVSTPATGYLTGGDTYIYNRFASYVSLDQFPVQSIYFSDFYVSDTYNFGRIFPIVERARQEVNKPTIRHGGNFVINSRINNLFRFNLLDYVSLDEQFGYLVKIIENGYTLKAYQYFKATSIYIDRTELTNADGSTNLISSDKVFASINPHAESYGCQHPESVKKHGRAVYFFDARSGVIVEDGIQGLVPISMYKANSWAKEMADKIRDASPSAFTYSCYGAIDKDDDLNATYILNVVRYNLATSGWADQIYSLGFSIIDRRFICKYELASYQNPGIQDIIPEWFCNVGNRMIMIALGSVYIHADSSDYCNIFGNQGEWSITFPVNVEYPKIKVFDWLGYYSNIPLDCPSITIPVDNNNKYGMFTRIKKNRFKYREGIFYHDIERNMTTSSLTPSIMELKNGNRMRGDHAEVTLSDNSGDKAVLIHAIVGITPSEKSH